LVELDCLRDCSFDYVICLFSTLGMIRGRIHRRAVLGHAARVLRPGGRFVLHVHNRWSNLWQPGMRAEPIRDLSRCFSRHAEPGDRQMPAHQGVAGLFMHLFTGREVHRDLESCGLKVVLRRLIGHGPQGELSCPWLCGKLRALGYLILAERS
jgi:SAM-dependent methyltransferase